MPGSATKNVCEHASVNVPRILRAMHAKRLTRQDAAAVCGVSHDTISKVLRGEMPRLDALYRVVDGLGLPMHEVLGMPQQEQGLRRVK